MAYAQALGYGVILVILLSGCGAVEHVYDMQPFPLEREPAERLPPLMFPPPPPTTIIVTTTGKPCDMHKTICLPDVVLLQETE